MRQIKNCIYHEEIVKLYDNHLHIHCDAILECRIGEMLEFFKKKTEPSRDPSEFDDDLDDDILFKMESMTYSAPQCTDKPLVKGNYHSKACISFRGRKAPPQVNK